MNRLPGRALRHRDSLPHASEDWERHRSRSPVHGSIHGAHDFKDAMKVSPDPIIEDFCWPSSPQGPLHRGQEDPMWMEASYTYAGSCYSPEGAGMAPKSPDYVPVSDSWAPAKPTAQDEILFSPGV